MAYKFHTNSRDYNDYQILEIKDLLPVQLNINPMECKLLNNDVFEYKDNRVSLIGSSFRKKNFIPGVLCLEGNKTYGRLKNKNLYKCIPDDSRLPIFLVPYEIKKNNFSKVMVNHYVTFEFFEWSSKHPVGKITQNLGEVSVLKNFYEYQLYCKSLYHSIQILNTKAIRMIELKKKNTNDIIKDIANKYNVVNTRFIKDGWKIFSIDPENSVDFDDAFSIKQLDENTTLLSIYISYVPIWIDYLDLWDSFSKRISTIYLPDKKRPMLPTILSDNLCSLVEDGKRFAICLDIYLENGIVIKKYEFCVAQIEVLKNYRYEEKELVCSGEYDKVKDTLEEFKTKKLFSFIKKNEDSHDVVGNLMLLFNYYSAINLLEYKNGIFRTSQHLNSHIDLPENSPKELSSFLQYWHNTTGSYQVIDEGDISKLNHFLLQMNQYVHMSSPIRRLVDLLNMIQFTKNHNYINFSTNCSSFYNDWIQNLEYINVSTRSIRKMQSDCQLLYLVNSNPEFLNRNFKGFCIDRLFRNDGLFQYIIFIPELKITSRLISKTELENYQENFYSLYIFKNENSLKKKIRIQLI